MQQPPKTEKTNKQELLGEGVKTAKLRLNNVTMHGEDSRIFVTRIFKVSRLTATLGHAELRRLLPVCSRKNTTGAFTDSLGFVPPLSRVCFVIVWSLRCLRFSCPARASRKRSSMLTWITGATTTRAHVLSNRRARARARY